jgi:hypothetical protein
MTIEKINKLKTYHWVIAILTIPILLLFSAKYFWLFFSTITNRSGFFGNLYFYYDLTKTQFAVYNLILVLILIGIILSQLIFIIKKNTYRLNITFIIMGILTVLIILSEIYLNSRFIGKG